MRILHTSDWHLGRPLCGRRRLEEQEMFLDWLLEALVREQVDILLVSGDVFDTTTPGSRAQELYYTFLHSAAQRCAHIVVTAGNHDSPTLLEAPRHLLESMHIHVVGTPENMVFTLEGPSDNPPVIVCAVPYLRDRDLRRVVGDEFPEDKDRNLIAGLTRQYEEVWEEAERRRRELGGRVPVIAMGHLFTAGAVTGKGDGVRELYVGSLARVGADLFLGRFDYTALGHLHVPQRAGGHDHIRYCGSPIPMSFGEAGHTKEVILVEFSEGDSPDIRELPVPEFRTLKTVAGELDEIRQELGNLAALDEPIFVEVIYTGEEYRADIREQVDQLIAGSQVEVLRIEQRRLTRQYLQEQAEEGSMEFDPFEVFERCLDEYEVPQEQRTHLKVRYREIVRELEEEDTLA